MTKAEQKRSSLEVFLKEQIIGPGAFNKRFFFLEDWKDSEFAGKSLKNCSAIDNISEVIAEVPAYQYSSAILFPISRAVEETTREVDQNDSITQQDEPNEDDLISKADDENFEDDKSESSSSLNQNYPNSCGISFAVIGMTKPASDLSVTLSYRKYQKLRQSECLARRLGYWIPEHEDKIEKAIQTYFSTVFDTDWKDSNLFVFVKTKVQITDYLYKIDYSFLNNFITEIFIPVLRQTTGPSLKELKSENDRTIFGIKDSKERRLYTVNKLSKRRNESFSNTVSIHTDAIVEYIKSVTSKKPAAFALVKELVTWLDVLNQLKEIVTDFKGIYRQSTRRNRPTPIWQSSFITKNISLPEMSNRSIERGEIGIEGDLELCLNFQYLRHKNDNLYIKLVVVNRNEVILSPDEPPQLNKKDVANDLAAFGVNLNVSEVKSGVLTPYNPPNLLELDEEDSLNKLLYRQFKDFGEGYNASATWGNHSDKRFVSTEFLPHQETPKIDFRPSQISGHNIVTRVDESLLSIKYYSTLSNESDEEVIAALNSFVKKYGEWISEKEVELQNSNHTTSARTILGKQLKGCVIDYGRLLRNITLLEKNKVALFSFRLMNTAMFMQLHHSSQIKRSAGLFVPPSNDEKYYQSVESDYKWRSFQLAFILINVDGFVRPSLTDKTVDNVFRGAWPERNEIADLVWFPTGGGKTEAYLGIIAFAIIRRRLVYGARGCGTTVLMRYTLRLLTLQQFQRATILICALEVIRNKSFKLPKGMSLGDERITIGLFVGADSLPNRWRGNFSRPGMSDELISISDQISKNLDIATKLPHTECPWCGGALFIKSDLPNVHPNPREENSYRIGDKLTIVCNTNGCAFFDRRTTESNSLPLRLFDEDIYKFPPTLLFGTVDKFAALANVVSSVTGERNQDARRIFGRGVNQNHLPPELIIQDELHLLLGPLGSAVGLFEKAVDTLCSYSENDLLIRPKIVTSTATTRNTDKQIFALFDRRSEVFPKQALDCDDSFFAFYARNHDNIETYASNRKYIGLLPVGKTQVWLQLRVTSIALVHRVHFIRQTLSYEDLFTSSTKYHDWRETLDFYHTVLAYFNSLKEVGKTQSQLTHYLPGDVTLILKNTSPWSIVAKLLRPHDEMVYSELTGRLTGKEVKTNLSQIERKWDFQAAENPPEYVISTNMISVGIDISRFNTMVVNSMPRNTAEYIQATSRVARDKQGIVFTVHHPFRSRDISHYQRFREFHEKFYGYVEPISVTPFANKALERYMAMYLAAVVRHNSHWQLSNNDSAGDLTGEALREIRIFILGHLQQVAQNAKNLNSYLQSRDSGVRSSVAGIIDNEELNEVTLKTDDLLVDRWFDRIRIPGPPIDLLFRSEVSNTSLFTPSSGPALNNNWNVKQSLREIAPSVVIKTVQQ